MVVGTVNKTVESSVETTSCVVVVGEGTDVVVTIVETSYTVLQSVTVEAAQPIKLEVLTETLLLVGEELLLMVLLERAGQSVTDDGQDNTVDQEVT